MELTDLLTICKAYQELGGSIQEQLHCIEQGEPAEEQNSNALGYIVGWLREVEEFEGMEDAELLADELDKYLTDIPADAI